MSEIMRPMPFDKMVNWIIEEYKQEKSIFGIRNDKFYKNNSGTSIEMFGDSISSPLGPAAGPNSQLAQNIVASYLAGARFMELKTVQIMDGEELRNCVARPCINATDECYNVEWSTELYVEEAMNEYIKAWFLLHVFSKELGLSEKRDFVFNISLGYDLEGIKSDKINNFVEGMIDASNTEIWNTCKSYLLENVDKFNNIDEEFINSIEKNVSPSVTLSTLHGCPPEEIERIAKYLMEEKHMHTFIKCNPTLLGYEFARNTLDLMGYDYLVFDDHHFKNDLQFSDAVPMFNRLIEFSNKNDVEFGLKLTNTFPVKIKNNELPGEEMYMSGRSLYPLTINLASKISKEFNGKLQLSYSGGADFFNIDEIIAVGIQPITVATTILKPGGYERFYQLAKKVEPLLNGKFNGINVEALDQLSLDAFNNKYHLKNIRGVNSRKTESKLELFDCYKAPCKDGGCPIEQQIPEYLKLVSEGKYSEAFDIISIDNALPGITGTICDHQCQNKCTRLDYDSPLQIRNMKQIAVLNAQEEYVSNLKEVTSKTNKKVLVIGAGAAGVSTALFLKRNGVDVTVYEKRDKPLGIVEYVIPEFRIPAEMIKRDFEACKKLGVNFKFNVNSEYNLEELKKEYDYIVLATGAWKKGANPLSEGIDKALEALEFLEESKKNSLNVNLGKTVVVVGGGDVSMDTARAAKKAPGVENVILLYRRLRRNMPASNEEIELALADGIEFKFLMSPISFDGVTLKVEHKELSSDNKSLGTGRFDEIKADTVINAIGSKVDTSLFTKNGIELNEWGLPNVNQFNESSMENIYIAGDCKAGAKTVVKAIADGKVIAKDILNKLGLANDFVKVEVEQNKEDLYAKKGILQESHKDTCSAFTDGVRCLTCDQVCDICTDVCPNRANISIVVNDDIFDQAKQILHIDGMCNECGNCGVFCPHAGNPYKDKVTLFWTLDDFNDSENIGFLKLDDGFKVRKEDGNIVDYKVGDNNISKKMSIIIDRVISNYNYLF